MANQETHTVEGLAYWAFLDEPRDNPFSNYEYDKKQWGVKLYVDKHNKALLESLNLTGNVGTDEEGDFYNFKLNYMTTAMKPMKPPKIVDADNKDITQTVRVGNGSKADLEFAVLNIDRGPAKGKNKPFIRKLQIIDLIPYGDLADAELDEVA